MSARPEHLVLGIESSCDDSSVAVLEDGRTLRAHLIAAQDLHKLYGGVVPELAARAHLELLPRMVERALAEAGVAPRALTAIAVTHAPGLVGSLVVGVALAKAYGAALGIPVLGVNHIEAHLHAATLEHGESPYPAVALVVSGGHTELVEVRGLGDYRWLGTTRDDAAGEAYDKVAKLLNLGYPGGPVIDRLAKQGNDRAVPLPTTRLTHADRNAPELKGDLDFSFSGLKTAVLRYVKEKGPVPAFSDAEIADLCATFQRIVVTNLIDRLFDAARRYQAKSIGIAGGVSANSRLRAELREHGERREIPTFVPSLALSTDNAAMIAAAGLRRFRAGITSPLDINADASLALT